MIEQREMALKEQRNKTWNVSMDGKDIAVATALDKYHQENIQ